jgi:hypothetical protein
MLTSLAVVLAFAVSTALGGAVYFRRVRVNRPPIGVVNLRDAVILVGVLMVMPYLYLALPLAAVTVLLGVVVLTALHLTLEPVLTHPLVLWLACVGLIALDVGFGLGRGVDSSSFLFVNGLILGLVTIGAANLWAQSGMKAREVAILAAVLTVYDVVATWQLTVMEDVFERLSHLPLVPVVAWGLSDPQTSLRLGLGDLLILTVAPLVFRKAFGRTAGRVALATGLAVVGTLLALVASQEVTMSIPVMAILGPLIVGQYWYWRHARGTERTTVEYLRTEPLSVGT